MSAIPTICIPLTLHFWHDLIMGVWSHDPHKWWCCVSYRWVSVCIHCGFRQAATWYARRLKAWTVSWCWSVLLLGEDIWDAFDPFAARLCHMISSAVRHQELPEILWIHSSKLARSLCLSEQSWLCPLVAKLVNWIIGLCTGFSSYQALHGALEQRALQVFI